MEATNRRRVWTLFISNIADSLHWQGVWQVFDRHGEVVDVFVPARKSKAGERFGFVRMALREAADRERAGYDRYSGDGIIGLDKRGIGGDYKESTMGVHVKQAVKHVQGVVAEDKREVLHTCAVAWCRGSLRGKALVEALHSASMKGCSVMRISGDAVLLMFATVEDRQAVLDRPNLEKWMAHIGEMVEVQGEEEDEVWRVWVQEVEQVHSHDIVCQCEQGSVGSDNDDIEGGDEAEGVFRENPLFVDKSPAKAVGFHDDQRGSRGMGDVEVGLIPRVEASEWRVWDVDAVVEFELGTQVRFGLEMQLGQLGENAGGEGPLTVVEGEWDSNSIQQNQVVLFKSNILGESVAEDNEKESVSIHEKEVSSTECQFSNSKIPQPIVVLTGPNTGSQQLIIGPNTGSQQLITGPNTGSQ
ncbi:hypothetical protein V6N13_063687 [Hibiscus sabdariffa]